MQNGRKFKKLIKFKSENQSKTKQNNTNKLYASIHQLYFCQNLVLKTFIQKEKEEAERKQRLCTWLKYLRSA